MRLGVIGDIHGIPDEFNELIDIVRPMVDQLWSVGDLVDRGPDSAACVRIARDRLDGTVMGNHEHTTISRWDRFQDQKRPFTPRSPDHARTIKQLSREEVEWMRTLPFMHVCDAAQTIIVHGGMWPLQRSGDHPNISIAQQPHNIIRAQMIHPFKFGSSKWWGPSALARFGKSEEDLKKEGWSRWYELWDHPYNVVFGHSVFAQPHLRRNPGAGYTIGTDTGGVFGGMLTAAIIEAGKEPFFVSVKAKQAYSKDMEGRLGQE